MNPNILVIAPDDLGREYFRRYARLPLALQIQTPNIDKLAQRGVTFTRAYSCPWCSPTRACWMCGRLPNQHGIGSLAEGPNQPLLATELPLPRALKLATDGLYSCYGTGKWHLSDTVTRGGAYEHPVRCGFDRFEGHIRNLEQNETYQNFEGFIAEPAQDGASIRVKKLHVSEWSAKYYADRMVEWIKAQTGPWFGYYAANLPHTPYNRPPEGTYDAETYPLPNFAPTSINSNEGPTFFKAMVQNLDWIVGYLQREIPQDVLANTVVLFWSDNGTQGESFDSTAKTGIDLTPYLGANYQTRSKRTVYELGCNIPLIVSGPRITNPGRTSSSLISPADLFNTVIELAGGDLSAVPLPSGGTRVSTSFAQDLLAGTTSARTFVPLDLFGPNGPNVDCATSGSRALCYARYKLIKLTSTGTGGFPASTAGVPVAGCEFFDLLSDPNEQTNLIGTNPINLTGAAKTAYDAAVVQFTTAFSNT